MMDERPNLPPPPPPQQALQLIARQILRLTYSEMIDLSGELTENFATLGIEIKSVTVVADALRLWSEHVLERQ
jgi:hypothetical protein